MNLLLIRHASNESLGKYLPGRKPDIHLDEEGIQQARKLANCLRTLPIEAIYSSPLERAVETAAPLVEEMGIPVILEHGFIEMDAGQFTAIPFDSLKAMDEWKELKRSIPECAFPGGESFSAAHERVRQSLERIKNTYSDSSLIAVFSHADIIKMIVAESLRTPFSKFPTFAIEPVSITIVSFYKEMVWLSGMNIRYPYNLPPLKKFK